MTFFTDRNLGRGFGLRLRSLGLSVELHDDHLPQETPDEEVLRYVAARGWILLTLDTRIRSRPRERETLMEAKAGVVCLIHKGRTLEEFAFLFHANLPHLQRFLEGLSPPFLCTYRLDPRGRARIERKL